VVASLISVAGGDYADAVTFEAAVAFDFAVDFAGGSAVFAADESACFS
jgi:hypothetical protein